MSENLKAKTRIKSMKMGNPIETEEGLASASFEIALPYTFRDDAVEFSEEEPEEEAIYCHETDSPLDVEVVGKGVTLSGTFVGPTVEQLVTLLGGKNKDGKFAKAAKKITLEKAIEITCHDDTKIIIPRAKGYVLFSPGIGKDGKSRFPFKFNCLPASKQWEVDVVW